jgi:TRAP-type mannitol/chloroaromatic compound transport system permease large subunit
MMTLPTTAQSGTGSVSFAHAYAALFQGTSMRISDGAVNAESAVMIGLPVIGFMVRTFENGQLTCGNAVCQGNYGGAFPHTSFREVRRYP